MRAAGCANPFGAIGRTSALRGVARRRKEASSPKCNCALRKSAARRTASLGLDRALWPLPSRARRRRRAAAAGGARPGWLRARTGMIAGRGGRMGMRRDLGKHAARVAAAWLPRTTGGTVPAVVEPPCRVRHAGLRVVLMLARISTVKLLPQATLLSSCDSTSRPIPMDLIRRGRSVLASQ